MIDREKVIKAVECRKNVHKRCGNPCERIGDCEYAVWARDSDSEPYYPCCCDIEKLCDDILFLLKEQEGYVSVPFSWLVKFCTHIDFKEPVTDEERELLWKQKLKQQFGIDLEGGS